MSGAGLSTPPRILFDDIQTKTPDATKARINYLTRQVSELLRGKQGLERKLTAAESMSKALLGEKTSELDEAKLQIRAAQKELERCKAEGDNMREELHLFSMVQQQKALLALAQEQVQVVELERRLVQAEQARIMRDHKISLFQAREEELLAEASEKDQQLADAEVRALAEGYFAVLIEGDSQAAISAQRSASTLSASSTSKELVSARAEITALEEKVDSLEGKVKGLKEKEKEARAELDSWLNDEKSKEGSSGKEVRDLQIKLKGMRNDLAKKDEELEEVKEELAETKRSGKEREKVLKGKIREATEERDKLLGVEEELESLRSKDKRGSPAKKVVKEKARKASPVQDSESEDDFTAPKKKSRKAEPSARPPKNKTVSAGKASGSGSESDTPVVKPKSATRAKSPVKTKKAVLETSDADNQATGVAKKAAAVKSKAVPVDVPAPSPEPQEQEAAAPVAAKKKKRILGGLKSTFEWDPILGSGEGPIPMGLSPMKSTGKTVGSIPRAGFSAASRLNRLG
ncbi:hypothetical protein IAU60_000926 [Kwoniella sp. DSM 27419]